MQSASRQKPSVSRPAKRCAGSYYPAIKGWRPCLRERPVFTLCVQSREEGSMSRPRKSSETLKLHGKFRADRHGTPEPAATGVLSKPDGFDVNAAWCWDQHIEQVVTNGAGGGDMGIFVSACEWWSMYCRMKELIASGDKDYRTFVKMSMAWKNYNTAASRLGLSPTERAKLRTQPQKKGKLSKFIG